MYDGMQYGALPSQEGPVITLLYADDQVPISTRQSGSQKLMDHSKGSCEDPGLTLNIEKSKTLVFGDRKPLKVPNTLKGIHMEQIESIVQPSGIGIPPDL